jgi:hypothetical protein
MSQTHEELLADMLQPNIELTEILEHQNNNDTEDDTVEFVKNPTIILGEEESCYKIGAKTRFLGSNLVAKNFFKKTLTDSNILPPVTRWIAPDMKSIAVERQPANITIKYVDIHSDYEEFCDEDDCDCEKDESEKEFLFNINIPWTVWFFEFADGLESSFTSTSVFARNSALTSMDDKLFALPVSNVYDDGKICWGNSRPARFKHNTLSSYIMHSINVFWTDDFNNDLTSNLYDNDIAEFGRLDDCDKIYQLWADLSMQEVLNIEFDKVKGCDLTFRDMCAQSYNQNSMPVTEFHLSKFFKEIFSE